MERSRETSDKIPAWAIVLMIGFAVALTALMAVTMLWGLSAGRDHIEDANGPEDASLAVIEREELLTVENNYTANLVSERWQGGETGVTGRLEDCDHDQISFRCEKITGIGTIQATNSHHDRLVLDIEAKLLSGNMEMVILVDGGFHDYVELNQPVTVTLDDVANKTVTVKIGAESAKTEITVSRSFG